MPEAAKLTSYSHGGGCACKLGIVELTEVLAHVRTTSADPALLVGLEAPDDAAVWKVTDEIALVQTVDFFTPIVDDAYDWGRIAAANALSDVYAMGGKPQTALSLVAWPRSLGVDLLGRVLSGAGDICDLAGVAIVGGHSVDDPEPKFGLAVTGTVHPQRIVRKTGAPAGCALVLTKPLGTGIISSAIKAGAAPPAVIERATDVMATLNEAAAEAMVEVGAAAATDVTGYGLMGHLAQMLDSTSAVLHFDRIPIIDGTFELATAGIYPGGSVRNLEALRDRVDASGLDDAQRAILFDAQTSGGLLIAVAEENASRLIDTLALKGVRDARRIGELVEGDGRIEIAA